LPNAEELGTKVRLAA
jgi:predicted XRE-type DNA-binding protein